jgi:acyl-CoA synthetase (AMP-forming)/AMP-acid ligase II
MDGGAPVTLSLNADGLLDAGSRPRRAALTFAGEALSYDELERASDRLAEQLVGLAPGPRGEGPLAGARVAVVAPNAPALVVAMRAAWRAGAACVPLSARLREYELRRILRDAEPTAVVSVASHQGFSFRELLPELLPEVPSVRGCLFVDQWGGVGEAIPRRGEVADWERLDPSIAAVLYTSGTTGAPKGALTTHQSLVAQARELTARLALTPDDTTLLVIPGTHAFGLACLLASLASDGTSALVDSAFSLEPVLAQLAAGPVTVLHGSPALFAGLLKRGAGTLGGKRGFVAGASSPPDLIERLDGSGATILNMFGMTEIGAACSCLPNDPPEIRRTTVGRPHPSFHFRVAAAGTDGSVGELEVRGPCVTSGYFRQPDLTANAYHGDWFRTGDLGSIDEGGHVRISGRLKELIHVGGFNVFPGEVEGCLLGHADVEQVAVVGVPHERLGEAPAAFVKARPGSQLGKPELLRFARDRIAGYKMPYTIEIVPELPVLASGKPDRSALRRRASSPSQTAHA